MNVLQVDTALQQKLQSITDSAITAAIAAESGFNVSEVDVVEALVLSDKRLGLLSVAPPRLR